MQVRGKKAAPTRKMVGGQPPQAAPAQLFTFPSPLRGWVLDENRATPQPAGARILDNWFCTTTGIRVRGGCVKRATITGSVQSLISYNSNVDKFFAANATGIYDITSPASPTTPITATVSGRTSGRYAYTQFGTAGGDYLYAVNGTDKALLFNGSTWTAIDGASTPAITGVTTSNLSQVWSYANRLFFVEKNTMKAWYLAVDSIGGAATAFSLAGVFTKGGSLLFGAKWSLDAGNGLDDKCVFVSTEGEVAIYQGTNPGSATDWSLAGLYQMPKPIGNKGYENAGGDLLIATEVGLIPISAAIQNDLGALGSKSVSKPIAPYWARQVLSLPTGWEMIKAQSKGLLLISQPDTSGITKTALAVNLLTGAWSRVTGWDTQCLGVFNDLPFFGAADGCIYLMDSNGSDAGAIYTASYLGQSEDMGVPAQKKTVLQMRPMFQTASPIAPQVNALVDFNENLPTPPSSVSNYTVDNWDEGDWDIATWDSASTISNQANWTSIGVTGAMIAPLLQLSFGISPTPDVELASIDVTFRVGEPVA